MKRPPRRKDRFSWRDEFEAEGFELPSKPREDFDLIKAKGIIDKILRFFDSQMDQFEYYDVPKEAFLKVRILLKKGIYLRNMNLTSGGLFIGRRFCQFLLKNYIEVATGHAGASSYSSRAKMNQILAEINDEVIIELLRKSTEILMGLRDYRQHAPEALEQLEKLSQDSRDIQPKYLISAGVKAHHLTNFIHFYHKWGTISWKGTTRERKIKFYANLAKHPKTFMHFTTWQIKTLAKAWARRLIGDRWGHPIALAKSIKGWKYCPTCPKKVAEKIADLPFWKKLAANQAWQEASIHYHDFPDKKNIFYRLFREKTAKGPLQFLINHVKTDLDARHGFAPADTRRIISGLILNIHKNLNTETQGQLYHAIYDSALPIGRILDILLQLKGKAYREALASLEAQIEVPEGMALGEIHNLEHIKYLPRGVLRMITTFGNNWRVWIKDKSLAEFHDLTYWLPLQQSAPGLDRYLLKYAKTASLADLAMIGGAWSNLTEDQKKLTPKKLVYELQHQIYKHNKSTSFAAEAARWGIPPEQYDTLEKRWLKTLDIPEIVDSRKTWHYEKYVGHFLPRSDPRGLFLGQHTNCCQYPGAEGDSAAWAGQETSNSGFFVVENKDSEIIAQSWCWYTNSGFVFDNVESKGLALSQNETVAMIYQMAANELIEKFPKVNLGTNYSKLDIKKADKTWHIDDLPIQLPHFLGYYTDAHSQVTIKKYGPEAPGLLIVTTMDRARQEGTINSLEEIAKNVYPPELADIPDDEGLVLSRLNVSGLTAIGYLTWNDEDKEITDIAIKKDYRKFSHALLRPALRHICRLGGSWTASCREATSFKLLKKISEMRKSPIEIQILRQEEVAGEIFTDVEIICAKKDEALS